jgi:hypothetical protein
MAGSGAPGSKDEPAPHDANEGKVKTMTDDGRKNGRKDGKDKTAARRDFLKLAGLGTLAGAAAAASGTPATAKAATVKSPDGSGYRETEHVKKAYELSRF